MQSSSSPKLQQSRRAPFGALFPDAVGSLRQRVDTIEPFAGGDVKHALVRPAERRVGGLARHLDGAEIFSRGVEDLNAGQGGDVDAILAIERHAVGAALLALGDIAQL